MSEFVASGDFASSELERHAKRLNLTSLGNNTLGCVEENDRMRKWSYQMFVAIRCNVFVAATLHVVILVLAVTDLFIYLFAVHFVQIVCSRQRDLSEGFLLHLPAARQQQNTSIITSSGRVALPCINLKATLS